MALLDTSAVTSTAMGWLQTGLFWIIFVVIILVGLIFYIKIKKWRQLKYPLIEIIGLGAGKAGFTFTKKGCGWFKSDSILFGLVESGEEVMKAFDGRRIFCSSSIDFHEIQGRRGVVCKRKDDDPKILVPLTSFEVKNIYLISEIASADFRDAASTINKQAENEMKNVLLQYLVPIAIGVFAIAMIISIVIMKQMNDHTIQMAKDVFIEAMQKSIEIKNTALPSQAPLLLPLLFRRKKK